MTERQQSFLKLSVASLLSLLIGIGLMWAFSLTRPSVESRLDALEETVALHDRTLVVHNQVLTRIQNQERELLDAYKANLQERMRKLAE